MPWTIHISWTWSSVSEGTMPSLAKNPGPVHHCQQPARKKWKRRRSSPEDCPLRRVRRGGLDLGIFRTSTQLWTLLEQVADLELSKVLELYGSLAVFQVWCLMGSYSCPGKESLSFPPNLIMWTVRDSQETGGKHPHHRLLGFLSPLHNIRSSPF